MKKYKYTKSQYKAFWTGRGYRAGQKKKRIPYTNAKNLDSFREGYKSAKNAVDKYPKLKKKTKPTKGKILKFNKNSKKIKLGFTKNKFFKPKKPIQPYWMNDWFDYDT